MDRKLLKDKTKKAIKRNREYLLDSVFITIVIMILVNAIALLFGGNLIITLLASFVTVLLSHVFIIAIKNILQKDEDNNLDGKRPFFSLEAIKNNYFIGFDKLKEIASTYAIWNLYMFLLSFVVYFVIGLIFTFVIVGLISNIDTVAIVNSFNYGVIPNELVSLFIQIVLLLTLASLCSLLLIIYIQAKYALTGFVIEYFGLKNLNALKKSKELTKDHIWYIVRIYFASIGKTYIVFMAAVTLLFVMPDYLFALYALMLVLLMVLCLFYFFLADINIKLCVLIREIIANDETVETTETIESL